MFLPRLLIVSLSLGILAAHGASSSLRPRIDALPESTAAERVKKAALTVAAERLASLEAAGGDAATRAAEIEAALGQPAEGFLAPAKDKPNLSVLRQPAFTEGNPFIDQLVRGAGEFLKTQDAEWPVRDSGECLFGSATSQGEYNPRTAAARMDALFWLFANPASPLKDDPAVLKPLLGRLLAYCDAIQHSEELRGGQGIYDDFAITPASTVLREFAALYPGLVLPSDRQLVNDAMRTAGEKIHAHVKRHFDNHDEGYANIDIAMSLQLLNFSLFLGNAEMKETSLGLLERVGKAVLPDGGFHYIWNQNESVGYHDVIVEFLGRMHEISGEEEPLRILKATEWYGPVSAAPIAEYWTAPSWKHTWNSELRGTAGGFQVASATENPFVRGILNPPDPTNLRGWTHARAPVAWYRKDIAPQPVPDRVLFPDRNIVGPRGRFGAFNYAATLRDLPTTEPGHATLVGAMTTTPSFGLNAILMGAGPRVFVGSNREEVRSWAFLTSGMKSSQVLSRKAAAFAASYDLARFGSSKKGPTVPARGQQLWLMLEDRVVGLLRIEPTEGDATDSFEGVLRLGTGGTVSGPPQELRQTDDGAYAYGDLVVVPHGHNFAGIETAVVPFRIPRFPITEIQWRGGEANVRWWVVEVRPHDAPPARVEIGNPDSQAPGFLVSTGERTWVVTANFGAEPARVELPVPTGRATFFTPDAAPAAELPALLPPGQVLLVVAGGGDDDHLPGWASYQDMIKALRKP